MKFCNHPARVLGGNLNAERNVLNLLRLSCSQRLSIYSCRFQLPSFKNAPISQLRIPSSKQHCLLHSFHLFFLSFLSFLSFLLSFFSLLCAASSFLPFLCFTLFCFTFLLFHFISFRSFPSLPTFPSIAFARFLSFPLFLLIAPLLWFVFLSRLLPRLHFLSFPFLPFSCLFWNQVE